MPGYLTIMRRHLVLVLAVSLSAGFVALMISLAKAPRYDASATVQLQQVGSPFRSAGGTRSDLTRALQTQVDLATGDAARALVRGDLGVVPPVTVLPNGETDELVMTASARSPEGAADAANAWARAYVNVLEQQVAAQGKLYQAAFDAQYERLEQQLSELDVQLASTPTAQQDRLRLRRDLVLLQLRSLASRETPDGGPTEVQLTASPLRAATVPDSPAAPRPGRNAVLGLLVGLVSGYLVACVAEAVNDRVRSSIDVRLVDSGVPVLGPVPVLPAGQAPLLEEPESLAAYQDLRAEVAALADRGSSTVLAVSGTSGGEGSATVAAGLAVMLALAGRRVALVDAELQQPHLHQLLSCPPSPGLGEVLAGRAQLDQACVRRPLGHNDLLVVPAGAATESDLLAGPAFSVVVGRLLEEVDVVVVSAPPLLRSGDALSVTEVATANLLVAGSGWTRRRELRGALARLGLLEPVTTAVVLAGRGNPRLVEKDQEAARGAGWAAPVVLHHQRRSPTLP